MNLKETLLEEVQQAPDAMLEEVLDFVRFLKSGRFAASVSDGKPAADGNIEIVFAKPRTLHDLAEEQRALIASLSSPPTNVDLPDE